MARLRLPTDDPDAMAKLKKEIQAIVGCLQHLSEVETEGVDPLWTLGSEVDAPPMREDIVDDEGEEASRRDAILQVAPQQHHRHYALPNIMRGKLHSAEGE